MPKLVVSMLLLLLFAAAPIGAQELAPLPPAPWAREDLEKLQALEKAAREALPDATRALEVAREMAGQAGLEAAEKTRRDAAVAQAQARLDSLNERLEILARAVSRAGTGPSAEQVAARRAHDALIAEAMAARKEIAEGGELPEGALTRAIRNAEDEFAHRGRVSESVEKADVKNSRVYERLNESEKLGLELRWATERFKAKVDEYDQLVDGVFAAFIAYEERALAAITALDQALALRAGFAGVPDAQFEPLAPPATEASILSSRREILELLARRKGVREDPRGTLAIMAYEGMLHEIQRGIDLREDYREQLELEDEIIKQRMITDVTAQKAAEVADLAKPGDEPSEEHQRLSRTMDVLRAEAAAARAEVERLVSQREQVLRVFKEKQRTEEEVENLVATTRALADTLAARSGATARQELKVFAILEEAAARNERLGSARLDSRREQNRQEILDRRIRSLNERILAIEDKELPALKDQYWKALGETAAWRAGRIGLVVLFAWLLLWVVKRVGGRALQRMMDATDQVEADNAYERQRKRTLFTVFLTTVRIIVWVTAILFALSQFEVDYGPLLLAAGGVSLAVGFGAQSLVKDFFAGFFILLEGQFSIGDVIQINDKQGTVESLNLRTTVIRSLDGTVHTIPNGVIQLTSNMTKVWSRAVLDIRIAYEENVDDVMQVLEAVGREMQQEEAWSKKLQEVILPGVDSFGDNSVNLRVLLKTRAGEQWGAARGFRRRVKRRFDEFDIQIPWPQRVISHKQETGPEFEKLERAKRSSMLRYVRHMRGEKVEEAEALSIEERDRAYTLAKHAAKQGDAPPPPASHPAAAPAVDPPKAPLSDAERLARELAEKAAREREEKIPDPPPPPAQK